MVAVVVVVPLLRLPPSTRTLISSSTIITSSCPTAPATVISVSVRCPTAYYRPRRSHSMPASTIRAVSGIPLATATTATAPPPAALVVRDSTTQLHSSSCR
uniref:Putative secreted peptide n=1 Tax=Anopheles braziliensis TaxID=58242 RepID=A0A2M3ZTK8_9DIPT